MNDCEIFLVIGGGDLNDDFTAGDSGADEKSGSEERGRGRRAEAESVPLGVSKQTKKSGTRTGHSIA